MAPWAIMTRPGVQEPADLASRPQPCPAALCPHESHHGWGSFWELHPALPVMTDGNAASAARYPPQLSSSPRWPPLGGCRTYECLAFRSAGSSAWGLTSHLPLSLQASPPHGDKQKLAPSLPSQSPCPLQEVHPSWQMH